MPSSNSNVRGLTRDADVSVELRPDESCEHMMRRVDRDRLRAEVTAVCRHLVGDLPTALSLEPAR